MFPETRDVTKADFDYVRGLAKQLAAIVIDEDKRYLVDSRLSPLAEKEGFESLSALVDALRRAEVPNALHNKAIDALTTNETLFFRDYHPFEALTKTIIPELIQARRQQRRLNIWSAASSSGQEAYSIAMLLCDNFPELATWDLSIIGTDICDSVLERARLGVYRRHEVNRGLPAALLLRHFDPEGDDWVVKSGIRRKVKFRKMNLMGSWGDLPRSDLLLCRNVLIYFDVDTRRTIFKRLEAQMAPDGYLILGAAETPMLITNTFRPVSAGRSVFYQLAR